MSNPTHFEIAGKDASKLQRFYRDAFGWQMVPAGPSYTMAHPGNEHGISGGVGSAPEGGLGSGVTVYVEVADLEAQLGLRRAFRRQAHDRSCQRSWRPELRAIRRSGGSCDWACDSPASGSPIAPPHTTGGLPSLTRGSPASSSTPMEARYDRSR